MTASVGRVSVITTTMQQQSLLLVYQQMQIVGSVTVATTTADTSVSVTGLAATGGVGSVTNVILH